MMPYPRKLLPPGDDDSTHFPLSPMTNSSLSPTSSKIEDRENPTTGVSCCAYNNLKLNPPFDSAMALTVLVLLTALFFMGFFSIYIRRFADESSVDPTRRRQGRTRGSDPTDSSTTTSYPARSRVSAKGVDPATIESLPAHAYDGGAAKQGMKMELECAICLSEFEEREWVKEIPYCGHVFHVECIDTWLSTHVTCPLCRTVKLFPAATTEEVVEIEEEVSGHVAGEEEDGEWGSGVDEVLGNVESDRTEWEVRLMVDETGTWSGEEREVGRLDVMRTTSCSVRLHRSLSF